MANHQLNLLRAKAGRIKDDYSSITMPMKGKALVCAKRAFASKFGMFDDYEKPLKTRETAAGMSELKEVERQLSILFNLAGRINDEEALLNMIGIMEKQAKCVEGRSALELAEGKHVLLLEELKLQGLGKTGMGALLDFIRLVRPKGELVLSPDEADNNIYLDKFDKHIGSFETRKHPLKSADDFCSRHYPVLAAIYNEESKQYEITSMPLFIEIPGNLMLADPIERLGRFFDAAKLDQAKFADKLLDMLVGLGAAKNDALGALNSDSSYSFVFRSLENGERPDEKNDFLQTRTEARVFIEFGKPEGLEKRFGVEASVVMPEGKVTMTSWVGINTFTNNEAHLELVQKETGAKPDFGIGAERLN